MHEVNMLGSNVERWTTILGDQFIEKSQLLANIASFRELRSIKIGFYNVQ